ncbi:hypothetical protein NDU88_003137 [Pleurodeles waltl]|uniref:Uncharacterized protein n=1 Tax=Pleurodeles waltl TaxID=8319 RepID=A0AAV7TNT5_PLEWA|nr:hypothetical protein NDU88_003137 [Pleurodeles waltl]
MDQRVIRAMELLRDAGRLDLIAAPAAPRERPVIRTDTEPELDGGAEKERMAQGPGPLPFLVAETENGHMTDENGWEEKKTRQMLIG